MTTWLVGASICEKIHCPKILGIIPIVPIEPNMTAGIHHMWQSYGAWTWAFKDFVEEVDVMPDWDTDAWQKGYEVMEPLAYLDRYEKIPKMVIVASNDQFMMFEWTTNWWNQMTGEKYLLINPNTEHTEATGLFKLFNQWAWFINKVKNNETENYRFSHSLENNTVNIHLEDPSVRPRDVRLRYAETL